MKKVAIKLNTVERVKQFCIHATLIDGKVDVIGHNGVRIDADSIIGIFSLDLTKDVTVCYEHEDDKFYNFLVSLM